MNLKEISLEHLPFLNKEKIHRLKRYFQEIPEDSLEATNPLVHLSASALVFVNDALFFVEHPYQKEWLLPAGHVEVGEWPAQTAQREFLEETGYSTDDFEQVLVDINVIPIPENPAKNQLAHVHIDLRYLLKLDNLPPQEAELPTRLLRREEAPEEFKKYYRLVNPVN